MSTIYDLYKDVSNNKLLVMTSGNGKKKGTDHDIFRSLEVVDNTCAELETVSQCCDPMAKHQVQQHRPPHPSHSPHPQTARGHVTTPAPSGLDIGISDQELMLRSWRRDGRTIAMGAGVGVLVLVLIAVTAALLSRGQGWRIPREESVAIAEVLDRRYATHPFNGTWVADSMFLYQSLDKNAILYDLVNHIGLALISNLSLISSFDPVEYQLSADHQFLLAVYNKTPLAMHMFVAQFEIINIDTQTSQPVVGPGGGPHRHLLQLAMWAPSGNGLVFVHLNDVYYRPVATDPHTIRLTLSGEPGIVYHGVPDWSYQDEILRSSRAMWFSPDGSRLAYSTFNDSDVHVVPITYYLPPNDLYPQIINVRYPKPGTPIPKVSLHVVNLKAIARGGNATPAPILPPQELQHKDVILSTVRWYSTTELAVVWINRLQDKAKVVAYSGTNGSNLDLIFSLEEREGWLDVRAPLLFSTNGSTALLLAPNEHGSDAGPFRHVTMVRRRPTSNIITPLTEGKFVAVNILAWDETAGLIFFMGTPPGLPAEQHLYTVRDDPEDAPYHPQCVSCQAPLVQSNAPCLHSSVSFSPGNTFYVVRCNGPDVPEISLYNRENHRVALWEDHHDVRERINSKLLPVPYPTTVKLPTGHSAQVRMWLPPNYDISKSKYALLVDVDGSPGSSRISERFHVDWRAHLVANRSFVYAMIEGRGSGLLGDDVMFAHPASYRRLGLVEVEDQINGVKELIKTFNYIDAARVGIWGWSYGGYSAAMVLASDTEKVFKCGISVAPIVNWRHYNALFTERYMHLPTEDDNEDGYDEADLTAKAGKIRNKRFLLLHGTMDTTVHYQHSLMLAKALQENGVSFQMHTYPDEMHGLRGVRNHVYHTMERFLDDCFSD